MDLKQGKTLIFDIETVGEDFDEFDETTQNVLTSQARTTATDEPSLANAIQAVRERLALNPLTGQIIAIGVLDAETKKGAVYYQSTDASNQETVDGDMRFIPLAEPEMLQRFWRVAQVSRRLVGFNSRSFDAFYLNIRSAVHGIRPSVNLMSNRYLSSQRGHVQHIDLLDQLKYYGAVSTGGLSLHMWCRAFGIKSPKDSGVDGSKVGELFRQGKSFEIARYNVADLLVTLELYRVWEKLLNFQQ
ncbi:MAG: ribonuclease H-like domain-containing protein [Patescibacteria group bacterium]